MVNLVEAARSTIPFQALSLTIEGVVRHPDTRTIEFTVLLKSGNGTWEAADGGKSTTNMTLAAVSLAGARNILASKVEKLTVTAGTQDPDRLAGMSTRLPVTLRVPRKTQTVRVVIEAAQSERIGAVELNRKTIDEAPALPTPAPKLAPRLPNPEMPTTSPN